jgi:hypothetical protein
VAIDQGQQREDHASSAGHKVDTPFIFPWACQVDAVAASPRPNKARVRPARPTQENAHYLSSEGGQPNPQRKPPEHEASEASRLADECPTRRCFQRMHNAASARKISPHQEGSEALQNGLPVGKQGWRVGPRRLFVSAAWTKLSTSAPADSLIVRSSRLRLMTRSAGMA